MFKRILFYVFFSCATVIADAQCVMCTKTAASLDDKAAKGLNGGIIYLAFMPLAIMGFIGFRWWRSNKDSI